MRLTLSDGQEAVREAFAQLCRREVNSERVRAAEPLGFDPHLWALLAETGAPGIGVPEEYGGGGGLVESALVCAELGQRLAPVPLAEAAATARLLVRCGSDLAAPAAAGSVLATTGFAPAREGLVSLVPAGAVADAVVALDGDALVLIRNLPAPTPPTTSSRTLSCTPVADVALAVDRQVLVSGSEAHRVWSTARDEWLLLGAAGLTGLAEAALTLGAGYVKERRQFGVPIGTFQSIAHRLADAATAVDGSRLLVYEAAAAHDARDGDAGTLSAMAFAFAAETAQAVTAASLHFHGGYGFMLEYDIQLYFRRAKAWSLLPGDPAEHLARIAGELPLARWN